MKTNFSQSLLFSIQQFVALVKQKILDFSNFGTKIIIQLIIWSRKHTMSGKKRIM